MTLESIAWRGVHVELPTDEDGRYLLVFGPKLSSNGVVYEALKKRVWIGTRTPGGNWIAPDGTALDNVTHWATMPTGADPR